MVFELVFAISLRVMGHQFENMSGSKFLGYGANRPSMLVKLPAQNRVKKINSEKIQYLLKKIKHFHGVLPLNHTFQAILQKTENKNIS